MTAIEKRFDPLSPREREIMIEVARGRLTKQIASDNRLSASDHEGASQPSDAEDERPLVAGAQLDGGQASPEEQQSF